MSDLFPLSNTLDNIAALAAMIAGAQADAERHATKDHARFNLFTTLLRDSDEVRLHTRFLHCMLDHEGFHDCGTLFIDLFFATLRGIPCTNHKGGKELVDPGLESARWSVEKEAFRPPHGKIDLLLTSRNQCIAIENKIFAHEQARQLACYHEYLLSNHGKAGLLIYLTLDGKQSGTHEGAPYFRISYARHILAWLDKCVAATQDAAPVHHALRQYREVVRGLTGKTMDLHFMKDASDFITKNPDIVKFRKQINEAIAEARASFLDRLADGLIQRLACGSGLCVELGPQQYQGRFGKSDYGNLVIEAPSGSPLHAAPFKVSIEHDSIGQELLVGITVDPDGAQPSDDAKGVLAATVESLRGEASSQDYKPTGNKWWPAGWLTLIKPMDDEEFARLMAADLDPLVESLSNKILAFITMVEKSYTEATAH